MKKKRARMTIEWDLDAIPGFNHGPEDMVDSIQCHLDGTIPHYNPQVTVTGETFMVDRPYNPIRLESGLPWRTARNTVNRMLAQGVHADLTPNGNQFSVYIHPEER